MSLWVFIVFSSVSARDVISVGLQQQVLPMQARRPDVGGRVVSAGAAAVGQGCARCCIALHCTTAVPASLPPRRRAWEAQHRKAANCMPLRILMGIIYEMNV